MDSNLDLLSERLYHQIISKHKDKQIGKGLFGWIRKTASQVFDKIKDVATGFKNVITGNKYVYLSGTRRKLEEYGSFRIARITVFRTPILNAINGILEVISIGKWNQLVGKYGYDALMHLSCLIELENGKKLYCEKNADIEISDNIKTNEETESMNVPLNGKIITLAQLFENGRKYAGNERWFVYKAFSSNCQQWILDLLQGSNLLTPELREFIYQDLGGIISELPPHVINVSNKVTNLGSVFNKLLGRGRGIILTKSNKDGKRFMVQVNNKRIHFGDADGKTYIDHNDDKLKDNYIARHKELNENWNDLETAGFWARWLLWEKKTINEAIKNIENRFKVKIINKLPK